MSNQQDKWVDEVTAPRQYNNPVQWNINRHPQNTSEIVLTKLDIIQDPKHESEKMCDYFIHFPLLFASILAHDGQKQSRGATEAAVWFHRLCVCFCVQGQTLHSKQTPTNFLKTHWNEHLHLGIL